MPRRREHPETTKMRSYLRWRIGIPMYVFTTVASFALSPIEAWRQAIGVVAAAITGGCMAVLVFVPELLERSIRTMNDDDGTDIETPDPVVKGVPWYDRIEAWADRYKATIQAVGVVLIPIVLFLLLRLFGE